MIRFGKGIVRMRYVILILALVLLIPSVIGFLNTRINYDILYYLPDDIETMQGQDVLLNDFGKGAYGIFVCDGLTSKEQIDLRNEIIEVDHVADVINYDSITEGQIPIEVMPDSIRNVFESKDGRGSLMFIFFDTTSSADETMDAIENIRRIAGSRCLLSSMAAVVTDTKNLVMEQTPIYTVIAVALALVVLFLMTDSFLVPIIFLVDIGISIIYNLGTNVFKGEISFITMALVAILQLAVTMDYSIFLYNSYMEQKTHYSDKNEAMANAIAATITSVTGSSLTTIAGFLAMCFMTFTLGLDMGVVMAKGVVLGVICCVTVLPSLILLCDKAITKTHHKALTFSGSFLSKFLDKTYVVTAVLLILLLVPAVYGYNRINVYYKLDSSLPQSLESVQANEALENNYEVSSVSMVLIDSDMSSRQTEQMIEELSDVEGVNFAVGLDSVVGPLFPSDMIPGEVRSKLESDRYKLILVSSAYQVATDEINQQCEQISSIIKRYDPESMLVGEAPATKDLIEITDHDFKVVSLVSIAAIFILILLVLKSATLPLILVSVVELAIYINMSISYYTGSTLPFIASICVGTIQLGATIDYAILLTNRYKTERIAGNSKKASVVTAVKTSVASVFSSALGFFAATIGVAVYSDIDLISSICLLLSRGALLSMVIVLTLLPSLLLIFDGVIIRTTVGMRGCIEKNHHRHNKAGNPAASVS
ncbi:MAG: MMPL family transporter [Clostridiales bacterium]|nr:MMPL family transporter [Clostridiales bacterium]